MNKFIMVTLMTDHPLAKGNQVGNNPEIIINADTIDAIGEVDGVLIIMQKDGNMYPITEYIFKVWEMLK